MGEKENGPFQFTFNGLLKVAFQGSHITSDAGLILVRELDERLGLEQLITDHLSDSGMSRALLKLSGSLVHDYATISDDSPSPNRASRARRAATSAGIS